MMDYMSSAIKEAKKAAEKNEVPVGAVVVFEGKIIARAHNMRRTQSDGTAHAEILALRKAGKKLGRHNLSGCVLYVTLEPCPMCAGAAVNSRIDEIVFGAYDTKGGGCGSVLNVAACERLNHRCKISGGVCEEECAKIMTDFFKKLR